MTVPDLGRLEGIWIKRSRGGPMDAAPTARLDAGQGIAGNANRGGRRQVTIIEQEAWRRVTAGLDSNADPSTRRANLMVSGIDLRDSHGRTLRIGRCRVRLFGETRPCNLMDESLPGLREALKSDWSGGAFGEVLDDGEISIGDPVAWEDGAARPT
ncbi:MAG TPA: MOSC domain-containing protein [Thermoanaerobaculia bacterium]|nr:MOSC domain-containing protein [Thermoanaerobaculia bacterium]